MAGCGRACGSRVGLTRSHFPSDHVIDLDGFDHACGGKLKYTPSVRADPHRHTTSHLLHVDLVRRVLKNPQTSILAKDWKLFVSVPVLLFCRCLFCHLTPSFVVCDWIHIYHIKCALSMAYIYVKIVQIEPF